MTDKFLRFQTISWDAMPVDTNKINVALAALHGHGAGKVYHLGTALYIFTREAKGSFYLWTWFCKDGPLDAQSKLLGAQDWMDIGRYRCD